MTIDENKKLAGDESDRINLRVKGNDENEMLFRIKRSTRLNKLMNAYCNKQSFDINSIKFLFNGHHVGAEQTPLELDMGDGAEIDAIIDGSRDLNHKTVPKFQYGSHNNYSPYVGLQSGPVIHNAVGISTSFVPVHLHNSGGNDKQAGCCATHLIDGDGTFNGVGLDNLITKVKLGERGTSYAVVAIMGPQCSGKSTLLNHLFHTNFREMDTCKGRSPTTKGLWIAKGAGTGPCTIVMDLQGTNEGEQGEDDTAFEKQSARFVLAISDIVIINMWCHDIGSEHAANKPLLKNIFQDMLRLYIPRKTSLVFVLRDKSSTPLENLEFVLREDILKIWDSLPKPEAYKHTPPSEFCNIEVVALSSYEDKREQFKEQVASLREKLFQSIITCGGLAGDRRGVVPASGFSFNAQQIWKVINETKDIDLLVHKVPVSVSVSVPVLETRTTPDSSCLKTNKRKHRKKQVKDEQVQKVIERWTSQEEFSLAHAWLEISEDPRTGDGQLGDGFWKRIRERFHQAMGRGEYRNEDKLSGKWSAMRRKIDHFNSTYDRVSNSSREGDLTDANVLTEAHQQYRMESGTTFTMENSWDILRKSSKWHLVPVTGRSSKRSKTTVLEEGGSNQGYSDARSHNDNLNDSGYEVEYMEEPPRPVGRDKSKAKDEQSSSSSMNLEVKALIESLDAKINRLLDFKEEKQRDLDLNFLAKDFSHLPDEDRAIFEARKAEIRAKYRRK